MDGTEAAQNQTVIAAALDKIERLGCARLENFARCVVLRSAKLSLDCRRELLSANELQTKISRKFREMLDDMDRFRKEAGSNRPPTILKCDASRLDQHEPATRAGTPRLIVTSPPYPGVQILYNRWQVNSRSDTPAPYWIANRHDDATSYTFGSLFEKELKGYFKTLKAAFSSLANISDTNTMLVQMVGFKSPDWQFPKYLEVMQHAGWVEINPDNRINRDVPNRRWYAQRQMRGAGSREVVLFHQPAIRYPPRQTRRP